MKLNLRSYRQLEQAIDKWIIAHPAEVRVNISIHNLNAAETIAKKQIDLHQRIAEIGALQSIRSTIRRDIQKMNEQIGVNELLSYQATIDREVDMLQQIVNHSKRYENERVIGDITTYVHKRAERAHESKGWDSTDCFIINLLSENDQLEIEHDINTLKRERRDIEDKLLMLNMTEKFEFLDSDQVQFLKDLDII